VLEKVLKYFKKK